MRSKRFWALVTLGGILLAGCSSTTLSGSWKSPDYTSQVKKVYIVGISKQETNRRIFEDEFNRQLSAHGVVGLSSYKDVPDSANIDEAKIAEGLKTTGADSVLMTNVTDKRTEEVVRQIIRHRFLDPDASARVIAQKLRQCDWEISTRSVQRVISQFGLQKRTPLVSP